MNPWIFALISVAIGTAILSTFKRRTIDSPTLNLLRVFFPSWRFFDQVGNVPWATLQINGAPEVPLIEPETPQPLRAIWNPWGNLKFAKFGLVSEVASLCERHLESEIAKSPAYRALVQMGRTRAKGAPFVLRIYSDNDLILQDHQREDHAP